MGNRILGSIGVIALVAVAAGCGSMPADADPPTLGGTSWVLAELPGRTLVPGTSVTLQFSDGRVSGTDGCNRYTGAYTTQGSSLEIPARLASTQMACQPDVTEQARDYITALTGATSYRVTGDRLELLSGDGATRARFHAQSQSLAGTAWRATGINNGKQAVVSVVKDSTVTMAFGADGYVSGSAGCNDYRASYTVDGGKLTIGQAAVTRKMCVQPGVMEQEQSFLKALGTIATSRVEGDRLELRTAANALAVALLRSAEAAPR